MWTRARVVPASALVLMCAIAAVTAQAPEFTKGTYTSHRAQDPSATIAMTFGDEGKLTVK